VTRYSDIAICKHWKRSRSMRQVLMLSIMCFKQGGRVDFGL
jgi:hypothetical protein